MPKIINYNGLTYKKDPFRGFYYSTKGRKLLHRQIFLESNIQVPRTHKIFSSDGYYGHLDMSKYKICETTAEYQKLTHTEFHVKNK